MARVAAFCTVQEPLINVLRYAVDARQVLVDVDHRVGPVLISVVDYGRGLTPAPSMGSGRV